MRVFDAEQVLAFRKRLELDSQMAGVEGSGQNVNLREAARSTARAIRWHEKRTRDTFNGNVQLYISDLLHSPLEMRGQESATSILRVLCAIRHHDLHASLLVVRAPAHLSLARRFCDAHEAAIANQVHTCDRPVT
jgi:hypothetical protein